MARERLSTREANRRKKTIKRNIIVSKGTQKTYNRPEDWPSPEELENLPSEEAHPTVEKEKPLTIDMTGKKAPSAEALETEAPKKEQAGSEEAEATQKETPSAEADEAVPSEKTAAEEENK